jgi:hypothetical protein
MTADSAPTDLYSEIAASGNSLRTKYGNRIGFISVAIKLVEALLHILF